jgi:cysteine desulfurase
MSQKASAYSISVGVKYQPYVIGGGQEQAAAEAGERRRIVAFGLLPNWRPNVQDEGTRIRALRDKLEDGVLSAYRERILTVRKNHDSKYVNIAFNGIEAEGVLMLLDQAGICASSGSACTTGSLEPSHVLTAMGCSAARARGSLRFSLGKYNNEDDVDHFLGELPGIIEKLRKFAPI